MRSLQSGIHPFSESAVSPVTIATSTALLRRAIRRRLREPSIISSSISGIAWQSLLVSFGKFRLRATYKNRSKGSGPTWASFVGHCDERVHLTNYRAGEPQKVAAWFSCAYATAGALEENYANKAFKLKNAAADSRLLQHKHICRPTKTSEIGSRYGIPKMLQFNSRCLTAKMQFSRFEIISHFR